MKFTIRVVSIFCLLAPALFSQATGIIARFPPQLKQYMELSDAQVNTIIEANASLQRFQIDKHRRTIQVEMELAQERAKTTIDPMALGVRYLELEGIRREILSEQQKTSAQIQNVLTPPQKTKLQTLQQALRLQSTICEAQSVNLLDQVAPNPFLGNILPSLGTNPFLFPGSACGFGIRSGGFGDIIFNPTPAP